MKSNAVRVLLAAVAAGVALTACSSSPVGVGTAATVGDARITSKELTADVTEYRAALQKAKIPESQLQMESVPKAVLLQLINFRQFEQFAALNGVTVTEGDVDKFIAEQGGLERIGPAALTRGVPPSETRHWIRTAVIYQRSLEKFGANLSDQASTQVAQQKLFEQMDKIPVAVSHRFGEWNLQQGLVDSNRFGTPASQPPNPQDPAAGQPDQSGQSGS
ncbi:SurA N-terminal domain-containing protein [Sphaerisporangium sp. B11E5]|uniref:SurA N-terminal domain-containing protein n=1 Tax=Sphaerisporangium sp. B11E5 TaxID=3153563 RepID=UPI00325CDAC2